MIIAPHIREGWNERAARIRESRNKRAAGLDTPRKKRQRARKAFLYAIPEERQKILNRNRERLLKRSAEQRARELERMRQWRLANPAKTAVYTAKKNELNKTDPERKLLRRLRSRVKGALIWSKTKAFKSAATMELVGADKATLMQHIESLFKPGMAWNNMGKWHLDHIKPCASFNLFDPEEQRKCFHYTNLQPLWALDNLSKGAKVQ